MTPFEILLALGLMSYAAFFAVKQNAPEQILGRPALGCRSVCLELSGSERF